MAVHKDPGTLREAVACMRGQSIATSRNWRLVIWLVCNGADDATREAAAGLAAEAARDGGPPVMLRELARANLAAALNLVVRESGAELMARMDADDACSLDRLEKQVAVLDARPDAAACFCAWETRDAADAIVQRFAAEDDASLVPWLLLLSNPFAHGSALMRREMVLAAGGYDETFPRAQDYDLWLRLSARGALVSACDTLYFHRIRHAGQGTEGARMQAVHAARARGSAMARLKSMHGVHGAKADEVLARLHGLMGEVAMGAAFADDARALVARLIDATGETPTREAVEAMLWARGFVRARSDEADRACFAACVREKWREMREAGVDQIILWGAGRHTTRVLATLKQMESMSRDVTATRVSPIVPRVTRIVDDHASGSVDEFAIERPEVLRAGDAVLISSDAHEAAMWARSAPLRERGVRVFRLYGV